jgi:hypothetical protein
MGQRLREGLPNHAGYRRRSFGSQVLSGRNWRTRRAPRGSRRTSWPGGASTSCWRAHDESAVETMARSLCTKRAPDQVSSRLHTLRRSLPSVQALRYEGIGVYLPDELAEKIHCLARNRDVTPQQLLDAEMYKDREQWGALEAHSPEHRLREGAHAGGPDPGTQGLGDAGIPPGQSVRQRE